MVSNARVNLTDSHVMPISILKLLHSLVWFLSSKVICSVFLSFKIVLALIPEPINASVRYFKYLLVNKGFQPLNPGSKCVTLVMFLEPEYVKEKVARNL